MEEKARDEESEANIGFEKVLDIVDSITDCDTREELEAVETSLQSLRLSDQQNHRIVKLIMKQTTQIERDEKTNEKDEKTNGTYLQNISKAWSFLNEKLPEEKHLMRAFELICRKRCPDYYQHIVDAAMPQPGKGKRGAKPPVPCLQTLGANTVFTRPNQDIFRRSINRRVSRAHVVLDSGGCAPGWGLEAEGATGRISDEFSEEVKDQIRVLRVMGCKGKKNNCVRRDVHNYLALDFGHKFWFDAYPRCLIIPISLSLQQILNYDGKTPYDVLFVAGDAPCFDCDCDDSVDLRDDLESCISNKNDEAYDGTTADFYIHELSGIDWRNQQFCTPGEVVGAFEQLCHWIRSMGHTFVLGIPDKLLERAYPKKNNGEQFWRRQQMKDDIKRNGLKLPKIDPAKLKHKVMKVTLNGEFIPDPWFLMSKAAVNFSYMTYGAKLRPVCNPPVDESLIEYAEAVQAHELRERERNVPLSMEISVPSTTTRTVTTERQGRFQDENANDHSAKATVMPRAYNKRGSPVVLP